MTSIPTLCAAGGDQTFASAGANSPCCPTCIPGERKRDCSKEMVDAAPICAPGVIPTETAGTGCPSCRTANGMEGTDHRGNFENQIELPREIFQKESLPAL